MRALLVNPWIYDFAAYDLWSKPLGLLNIASYLRLAGWEVSLIDCLDRFHPELKNFLTCNPVPGTPFGSGPYYSEAIEKPSIFKDIPRRFKRYGLPIDLFKNILKNEKRPDIVLVGSGMTYWYPAYFDAIKILREEFRGVPIALGGVYANLCFEHARAYSGADFVYKGSGIPGVLDSITKLTGAHFDIAAIDGAPPLLSYDLYPEVKYVTLRTSKGCPFRCTYCGSHLLEKDFIQQDASFVVAEIEYFYKNYGVKNFSFYDDALLYNAEGHIIKILNGLFEKNIKAFFHTPNALHNRFLTARLARLLKASGFMQPRLALETSSSKRQFESGAKTTNEEFLTAVTYLKEAGYRAKDIGVYILIGLPEQPADEIRASIEFAASQNVRIFLEEYSPIPGTPDYQKSGLAPDADPLLHNNSAFPLYRPDQYHEFQNLKDRAHRLNESLLAA